MLAVAAAVIVRVGDADIGNGNAVVVRVVAADSRDDGVGDIAIVTASSTPVTVTVCGVFQLAGVKTNAAGLTVPSLTSLLARATVTVPVGSIAAPR